MAWCKTNAMRLIALSTRGDVSELFQLSPTSLVHQTLILSGTMTATGHRHVDGAITRLVEAETALLANLSSADQADLAALLRKLSLDFDQEREDASASPRDTTTEAGA